MFNFAQARTNMVDSQLRPNGITDARILDAMALVAREDFVGSEQQSLAYMDGDVALKEASNGPRFLIEPMAFARMLQAAEVQPNDRVLDIGTATGYGAAVLSHLVAQIVAVDSDALLAAAAKRNLTASSNVTVVEGELSAGVPSAGLFDTIVIEGRIEEVPNQLFAQVKDGGRVVAVVGSAKMAKCFVYKISGQTHTRRPVFDVSVAALPGFGKVKATFAF